MKFIKPSEISSKIMTLFEESDEFVIIVSPYVKISKWYKLLKKFDNLKRRNIPFQFIIRDDKTNQTSFQELNELGIDYSAIPDLHCKLYLNEKYAIVSSMNLLLSSEINSLELAYVTETAEEHQELIEFSERYLNIDFTQKAPQPDQQQEADFDLGGYIEKNLSNKLGSRIRVRQNNGSIDVNTRSNNYSCFIWNAKQNFLRISGILSGKEYDYLNEHPEALPQINGLKVELQKGGNGYYDSIWATSESSLKSYDLVYVYKDEKHWIADRIVDFASEINGYKDWVYENLR